MSFPPIQIHSYQPSANVTLPSPEVPPSADNIELAEHIIVFIIGTLLYLIGIPGNIITIIVFQKRSLKDNFLSVFFTALCVGNLLCLFVGLSRHWYSALTGRDFHLQSCNFCKVYWFLLDLVTLGTLWFVVFVTAGRLHMMVYPLMRSQKQTSAFALKVLLIYLISYIPLGLYFTKNMMTIRYKPGSRTELEVCDWNRQDPVRHTFFVIAHMLPIVMLVIANGTMLYVYHRKVAKLSLKRQYHHTRRMNSVTALVLATGAESMLTSLPLAAFNYFAPDRYELQDPMLKAKLRLGNRICILFLYMGNAFSCIIYSIFGSRYREEIAKVLGRSSGDVRLPSTGDNCCSYTSVMSTAFTRTKGQAFAAAIQRHLQEMRETGSKTFAPGEGIDEEDVSRDCEKRPHIPEIMWDLGVRIMSEKQHFVSESDTNEDPRDSISTSEL